MTNSLSLYFNIISIKFDKLTNFIFKYKKCAISMRWMIIEPFKYLFNTWCIYIILVLFKWSLKKPVNITTVLLQKLLISKIISNIFKPLILVSHSVSKFIYEKISFWLLHRTIPPTTHPTALQRIFHFLSRQFFLRRRFAPIAS